MGMTKYGAKPGQVSKTAEGNPGVREVKRSTQNETVQEKLDKRKKQKG